MAFNLEPEDQDWFNGMREHKRESQIHTYDCTIWAENKDTKKILTPEELITIFKKHCKKYAFQLERAPQTGKLHYQCRISFKVKQRLKTGWDLIGLGSQCLLFPTSSENRDNNFYVTKDETRVEGPWMDTDPEPEYVPRQVRKINDTLLGWQERIVNLINGEEDRKIRLIYCPKGNNGKTILTQWMRCKGLARNIPPCNDYKDIMRIVMCVPIQKCYIIDMPRALKKGELSGFFSGIESLKDGYVFDDRYHFKDKLFDAPQVVVFTNSIPDPTLLSDDKWDYYTLINKELYKGLPEMSIEDLEKVLNRNDPH